METENGKRMRYDVGKKKIKEAAKEKGWKLSYIRNATKAELYREIGATSGLVSTGLTCVSGGNLFYCEKSQILMFTSCNTNFYYHNAVFIEDATVRDVLEILGMKELTRTL